MSLSESDRKTELNSTHCQTLFINNIYLTSKSNGKEVYFDKGFFYIFFFKYIFIQMFQIIGEEVRVGMNQVNILWIYAHNHFVGSVNATALLQ